MNYIAVAVLTAVSDTCIALDGIIGQANNDSCYVQETNRFYRWIAASTAAANGTTVVIPDGQAPATPGRWFVQGPPGPVELMKGFPARIQTCPPTAVNANCASEPLVVNAGTGVAAVDMTAALAAIGNPTEVSIYADLQLASIQDVDGEFPVAEHHPVIFMVDAAGDVSVSAAVLPVSPTITNPDPAAAQVQGGTANFATGSVSPALTITATGTDQILTVTYTPDSGSLAAGTAQLCLGPTTRLPAA